MGMAASASAATVTTAHLLEPQTSQSIAQLVTKEVPATALSTSTSPVLQLDEVFAKHPGAAQQPGGIHSAATSAW